MKTIHALCGAALLVLLVIGGVGATPYTFEMGAGSRLDTSNTNNVLQMYAAVNPDLDDITYQLGPGQSESFYFATVGTREGWIDNDDLIPGNVTAYIDFDTPDMLSILTGLSVGFNASFLWFEDFFQGWALIWNDPLIIDLGDDGQFSVELSDVGYNSWLWQGPTGSADVSATITYNLAAPVPEPSTILLMGIGLLALATYSRRRFRKKNQL